MLDPPLPVSATEFLGNVTVVFSHPIADRPLSAANWSGRLNNKVLSASAVVVNPANNVAVQVLLGLPDLGPDVISYAAAPPDVVSGTARAVPAPAFADFPIT